MEGGKQRAVGVVEARHHDTRPQLQDGEILARHPRIAEGEGRARVLADDARLRRDVVANLAAELIEIPGEESAGGKRQRAGARRERHHQQLAANRQVAEPAHCVPPGGMTMRASCMRRALMRSWLRSAARGLISNLTFGPAM